jgi:hypothetical protein
MPGGCRFSKPPSSRWLPRPHRRRAEHGHFMDTLTNFDRRADRNLHFTLRNWLANRSSRRRVRSTVARLNARELWWTTFAGIPSEGWRRRPDLNRGWRFCNRNLKRDGPHRGMLISPMKSRVSGPWLPVPQIASLWVASWTPLWTPITRGFRSPFQEISRALRCFVGPRISP